MKYIHLMLINTFYLKFNNAYVLSIRLTFLYWFQSNSILLKYAKHFPEEF